MTTNEWTPRTTLLREGIFEISVDSEGYYHIAVPDGKREKGLSPTELEDLRNALIYLVANMPPGADGQRAR